MSSKPSPLLKSWHWEGVLLPMPREVQRQATAAVSKRLRQLSARPSLANLKVEAGDSPLLYATLDGVDEFDLEILEDLVAYQYDPDSASERELLQHLRRVAEPVMNAVTAEEWFENVVLRTVIGYRLELAPAPGGANLDRLFELTRARPELPGFGGQPVIGLDLSLGYETKMKDLPVELWVEFEARRAGDINDDDEDAVDRDDDVIEATVFVQTPRGRRPEPRWMTNLVEIHEELWPRIRSLVGEHL